MTQAFATRLRAWWAHRQGMDGSLTGASAATVFERTGWGRSVGGAGPYLTLFSRAGISRAAADTAVADLSIHELPAARGCTYVLPRRDFALGLALGDGSNGGDMAQARKLGVTDTEIDALCTAVIAALAQGPLSPEALREATGRASRSLGDEGKKKGLSTTLPLAFGRLQGSGDIRRVPVNGRLDQQRYAYARWSPNPRTDHAVSATESHVALAALYYSWIGPASLKEFQWFSGLSGKLAKDAVAALQLQPIAPDSSFLLPSSDLEAFHAFRVPGEPQYAVVSSLDTITAARRNVTDLLDERDLGCEVVSDASLKSIGHLSDLPSHAIFDRGRLIGLWEYDPDAQQIVHALFRGKPDAALKSAIARTETFVRDQLGDMRSFSLDSPKSRAPRIAALRKANKR